MRELLMLYSLLSIVYLSTPYFSLLTSRSLLLTKARFYGDNCFFQSAAA